MYLNDSGPPGENPLEVVHGVTKGFPVILRLVVVHPGDVLVRLAGDRDGVR